MVRRAIICSPVRLALWCSLTPQICACRMRTIGLKACDGSSIRGHIDANLGDDPREESPAVIRCTRIRCRPLRVSKGPWPRSPEDFRHTNPSDLSHLGHYAGQTLVATLEQIAARCRGLYSPESAVSALGRLSRQCYSPKKTGARRWTRPKFKYNKLAAWLTAISQSEDSKCLWSSSAAGKSHGSLAR